MADKLYCPRCATAFSGGTSFCRTCGLALGGVSEIVRGDTVAAPVTYTRPSIRRFGVGVGLFMLGLVIGLLNAMLRDFHLFPEKYGKMVFLLFIILALLTIGSAFLFPTKVYPKRKRSAADLIADPLTSFETAPLAGLPSADTLDLNTINFAQRKGQPVRTPAPSVTEQTTRNLE